MNFVELIDGDTIAPEARALADKYGIKAAPIVKSEHPSSLCIAKTKGIRND